MSPAGYGVGARVVVGLRRTSRVLIIGDSIARMYSRETSSVFKDKAKVEVGYKAGVSA